MHQPSLLTSSDRNGLVTQKSCFHWEFFRVFVRFLALRVVSLDGSGSHRSHTAAKWNPIGIQLESECHSSSQNLINSLTRRMFQHSSLASTRPCSLDSVTWYPMIIDSVWFCWKRDIHELHLYRFIVWSHTVRFMISHPNLACKLVAIH